MSFRWKMGDWVGGDTAVHQAYKPFLCMKTPHHNQQAVGQFLIQPRDTANLEVSGLGFTPTVVLLISYRPRNANGGNDAAFGSRGGGMTFGAAGWEISTTTAWDADDAYVIADRVVHNTNQYIAANNNTNSEPPSGDWTLVPTTQFTGTSKIRHAFEIPGCRWREDVMFNVINHAAGPPILTLSLVSLNADGFTLSQDVNLYDQTDYVAWIALGGKYGLGVMEAGDTTVSGFDGTPGGAMFLSVKHLGASEPDPNKIGYWDHMTGFAATNGQAVTWGGRQPTEWDWTTGRWEDDAAILLCTAANWAGNAGASVIARGEVTDWHANGIDIQWPIYDNGHYKIGYLLCDEAEQGVLETNWETRPGGSQNAFPGGVNLQVTEIRPDVILMCCTDYYFSWSDGDPFNFPQVPGTFQRTGGGGSLGWHAQPFSDLGYDAWGVHTAANGVAERGRYANSATQLLSRYILAGQGSSSSPPAAHQHSVNVIPNPVIVGINYRYAERHAQIKRLHVNESDLYIP